MPRSKSDSRALRQLAENLLRQIFGDYGLVEPVFDELATSLVRQWVTYEGNATLFVNGEQFYFVRGWTPLGADHVFHQPAPPGAMHQFLVELWRVSPEDLPEVYAQLNRGQSAEVTNADGRPLRISVNPQERSRHIEPLVPRPVAPDHKPDCRKMATHSVEKEFGRGLHENEREALSGSVAQQWQKYQGHACLFAAGKKHVFTLTKKEDGGWLVEQGHRERGLEAELRSLGFAPQAVPGVIARINLDQEIEFEDPQGARWCMWHDPSIEQLRFRPLDPVQPAASGGLPPVFCPHCNALLSLWQEGRWRQTCPQCGQAVARS
jgi:hypothetical protein